MKSYLSLIKFSHTIFAMPFAMLGYFTALQTSDKSFSISLFLLVVLCMVFARSAAMAFNRWADSDIDKLNPRTAVREIPSGIIHKNKALFFVILNAVLFIATTFFINRLCFYLSPIALFIVLSYSYTKRYTFLCHLILGLGLALAPIGAYLSVNPVFNWIPVLYGLVVLFWVSGFDIIYALQDEHIDKDLNLYSIPSFFGSRKALLISMSLHIISAIILIYTIFHYQEANVHIGLFHIAGIVFFIMLLIYQHTLVKVDDLSKVNLAFFTTNGISSMIFCLLVIIDFYF
jgi:4-hydroxybenzoate polyprenyltransferase